MSDDFPLPEPPSKSGNVYAVELVSGSFGGAAQVIVGQPLDTLKTVSPPWAEGGGEVIRRLREGIWGSGRITSRGMSWRSETIAGTALTSSARRRLPRASSRTRGISCGRRCARRVCWRCTRVSRECPKGNELFGGGGIGGGCSSASVGIRTMERWGRESREVRGGADELYGLGRR